MVFVGIKRSMMAKQNSLDDVGLELEGDDQVISSCTLILIFTCQFLKIYDCLKQLFI